MTEIRTLADLIAALRKVEYDHCEWDYAMTFDGEEYDGAWGIAAEPADRPGRAEAIAYAAAVKAMQDEVWSLRDQAIAALEAGELKRARKALRHAASREREFGDDPTYGPLSVAADRMAMLVEQYAADGSAPADLFWCEADSLAEARSVIAERVSGDLAALRWQDPTEGVIEAYHESADERCGGYLIRVEAA